MKIPYANRWGVWYLDTHTAELVLILEDPKEYGGSELYRIDLERCKTTGEVLDWIQHMTTKVWSSKDPRVIADLVIALNDILGLPGNYCGSGATKNGLSASEITFISRQFKGGERSPQLGWTWSKEKVDAAFPGFGMNLGEFSDWCASEEGLNSRMWCRDAGAKIW